MQLFSNGLSKLTTSMVKIITPDACVIVLQAEMCPIFSVDSFYHKGACLVFVFYFLSPHVVITWHLVTDMIYL